MHSYYICIAIFFNESVWFLWLLAYAFLRNLSHKLQTHPQSSTSLVKTWELILCRIIWIYFLVHLLNVLSDLKKKKKKKAPQESGWELSPQNNLEKNTSYSKNKTTAKTTTSKQTQNNPPPKKKKNKKKPNTHREKNNDKKGLVGYGGKKVFSENRDRSGFIHVAEAPTGHIVFKTPKGGGSFCNAGACMLWYLWVFTANLFQGVDTRQPYSKYPLISWKSCTQKICWTVQSALFLAWSSRLQSTLLFWGAFLPYLLLKIVPYICYTFILLILIVEKIKQTSDFVIFGPF